MVKMHFELNSATLLNDTYRHRLIGRKGNGGSALMHSLPFIRLNGIKKASINPFSCRPSELKWTVRLRAVINEVSRIILLTHC